MGLTIHEPLRWHKFKGTVSRDEKFFGRSSKSNQYFLYMRRWFIIFLYITVKRKILLKFLLASINTLTYSGDFTGSRIRFSNSGGTSKRNGNLNTAFEKTDSQSSACGFEK
jgi:hypothetical protein